MSRIREYLLDWVRSVGLRDTLKCDAPRLFKSHTPERFGNCKNDAGIFSARHGRIWENRISVPGLNIRAKIGIRFKSIHAGSTGEWYGSLLLPSLPQPDKDCEQDTVAKMCPYLPSISPSAKRSVTSKHRPCRICRMYATEVTATDCVCALNVISHLEDSIKITFVYRYMLSQWGYYCASPYCTIIVWYKL